jgi:hypothetical protein
LIFLGDKQKSGMVVVVVIDNHYGFLQKTGQIETKGHHPLIVKI